MAFSTSGNLAATATEIITEALEVLGVLEEGEAPSAAQSTSALRSLNYLIKLWGADHQVWAQGEYRLNLVAGTNEYTLDSTNVGYTPQKLLNATRIDATFYDSANFTVIYDALAVSTYTVGETITFSGGSTAIVITDDAATTATVRLAEDAATPANDETMLGGTSATTSTVNGTPAAKAQAGASDEATMNIITQEQWYALSDKKTTGTAINIYSQRLPEPSGMKLSVWPVPANTDYDLKLWIQYPYRDVDSGSEDLWCTQEWYLPFSYGLALILSGKYGISEAEKKNIFQMAETFKFEAETFQTDGSVLLQPNAGY